MAREPDVDREPTPVIPALCRGWRMGCAFRAFLSCFPIMLFIATYEVLRVNDQNWFQRMGQDPMFLIKWMPLIIGIGFAGTFAIALVVYDFLSIKLYKWWYSK